MENDIYLHELLYRGPEAIEKLATPKLALCGAGALGSLLADNLARQGVRNLTVIDDDRVESHNVGTQIYGLGDVGAYKVNVLRAYCFRAVGVELNPIAKRLEQRTVRKILRDLDLVVDTFDNSDSRRLVSEHCHQNDIPCLHLGMNADFGEVRWNDGYRIPADVVEGDVCDYPLARNLILLVVTAGSETLLRYILDGVKENYSITLRDLKINLELD